jgi:uncharacterized Rmd1/YagE family protein
MMCEDITVKSGAVILYRIYDVAEEFDLQKVEQYLQGKVEPVQTASPTAKAIQIEKPPLGLNLGSVPWQTAHSLSEANFVGRIFDLGAISLQLRFNISGVSLPAYEKRGVDLFTDKSIDSVFDEKLEYLAELLSTQFNLQRRLKYKEDYIIFYLQALEPSLAAEKLKSIYNPTRLLMGETKPLSPSLEQEVLKQVFSYSPDDYCVLNWDSAFVYEATGSMDMPDLLEFANVQSLELVYYDDILDKAVEESYATIKQLSSRFSFFRMQPHRDLLKRILGIGSEMSMMMEKIANSIKTTQDPYFSHVYSAAMNLFRAPIYAQRIRDKLGMLREVQSLIMGDIATLRAEVLEMAIIILIALEILLAIFRTV